MNTVITPEEGAELKELYAELPAAYARAAAALRTDPPGHLLEGVALERFLAEDEKVAVMLRRVKEILGTTGEPWNA